MAKAEYYEPKLLDGEREQPGILVDAVALLGLYLRALPNLEYTRNELLKHKYNFKYHTKHGKRPTYYNGGFVPLPAPGAA